MKENKDETKENEEDLNKENGNKQITMSKKRMKLTDSQKIITLLLSIIAGGTIGSAFNEPSGTFIGIFLAGMTVYYIINKK